MTKQSSKKITFINLYLDKEGKSKLIKRDNLQSGLAWTSGDGIFRMDSAGSFPDYLYCYFSLEKIRYSWKITDISNNLYDKWINIKIKIKIKHIYECLKEANLLRRQNKDGKFINGVKYIQFYGKKDIIPIIDMGIRSDIRKTICSKPCCVCYITENIECDHKNDLKNDPRVLNKKTQTLDDFQPLCKHCNMLKKSASQKRNNTNKRVGATKYGYNIDFISGDEKLDKNDPYWYKGTYWGDVIEFKKSLTI